MPKGTSFSGGQKNRGENIMNRKIIYAVGAVLIFSMSSLGNMFIEHAQADAEQEYPYAVAGGPYEGHVNDFINFDGSDSYDNDGEVVEWQWDFDDGAGWEDWEEDPYATYQYENGGIYNVKLRVKDDDGAISLPDTAITTIHGYCALDIVVTDRFPYLWFTRRTIYLDIDVQNYGPNDCYWFEVEVEIWKGRVQGEAEWLTDLLPNIVYEGILEPQMFNSSTKTWQTIIPGYYWVRVILTWEFAEEPVEDWDRFLVWPSP